MQLATEALRILLRLVNLGAAGCDCCTMWVETYTGND